MPRREARGPDHVSHPTGLSDAAVFFIAAETPTDVAIMTNSSGHPMNISLTAVQTAGMPGACPWTLEPLAQLCASIDLAAEECNTTLQWSSISLLQVVKDGVLHGIYHTLDNLWRLEPVVEAQKKGYHRAGMVKVLREGACTCCSKSNMARGVSWSCLFLDESHLPFAHDYSLIQHLWHAAATCSSVSCVYLVSGVVLQVITKRPCSTMPLLRVAARPAAADHATCTALHQCTTTPHCAHPP